MKEPQVNLPYADRREAGRILAKHLELPATTSERIVLGLARGGVPVAYEVAHALRLPLEVWVVRKLGVPGQEELALGAIASGGICILNDDVVAMLPNPEEAIENAIATEKNELLRRENTYRKGRDIIAFNDKEVLLVDDGLATGATMRSAVKSVRQHGVRHVTIAVPVGSSEACALLRDHADEVYCMVEPSPFYGVGRFYEDFTQTTDDEIGILLSKRDKERKHRKGHPYKKRASTHTR